MVSKRLLIVAHTPSENTRIMLGAIVRGAQSATNDRIEIDAKTAFETNSEQVIQAQAIILGTTENLGYMSGGLKDFFDRIYYPCLETTQGLPYSLVIRAGQDGTGTLRAIDKIAAGLRWRAVQKALFCKGEGQPTFVTQCEELGAATALGLDLGIF